MRSAALLAEAGASVEHAAPDLEDVWPITMAFWHLDGSPGSEVDALFRRWDDFRTQMLGFMRRHDVVLCPVDRHPAPPHDEKDLQRFSYTLPYSLTGWPCAVVRAGTSPEGLPIGVQVVARRWREDVALAVALHIEAAGGGWRAPA